MLTERYASDPNANVEQFGHFTANFSAFVRRQLDFAAGGLFRGERVANYTIESVFPSLTEVLVRVPFVLGGGLT